MIAASPLPLASPRIERIFRWVTLLLLSVGFLGNSSLAHLPGNRGSRQSDPQLLSWTESVSPMTDPEAVVLRKTRAFAVGKPDGPTFPVQGKVVVMGQVHREGIIAIREVGDDNILNVIARCGGFTRLAYARKTKIRRAKPDGSIETITVDLEKLQKPGARTFRVRPGDTIFIPEGGIL